MNRRVVIALAVPMIVGMICLGVVSAYQPVQYITAETRLTRRIFRGVGDMELPWLYIYIVNPTWQKVGIIGVQLDAFVNGENNSELSYWLSPVNFPGGPNSGWDTEVLPFEKSVILWFGWIVGSTEPEGNYRFDLTIYATDMAEEFTVTTRCTFQVFL